MSIVRHIRNDLAIYRRRGVRFPVLREACNLIVAYLVPGPVWRTWQRFPYWHRWYWRNR